MAGELIAQLDPGAFFRETSVGYMPESFAVPIGVTSVAAGGSPGGSIRGVGFNKFTNASVNQEYYQVMFEIPANLTIATGITVKLRIADDGKDANDLGKVVKLGITAFNMDSASFKADLSAASGAEQTGTATLSSTSLIPVTLSIAIANAQLSSAGAGNAVLLRIRRLGADASDTCNGRVVVPFGHVKNT